MNNEKELLQQMRLQLNVSHPNLEGCWLDAYDAVQDAHSVILLTEWNEFRALDLKRLGKKMNTPRMADLRNVYTEKDAKRAGFEAYVSTGRHDYFAEG